jgi:hypothetical protein
MPKFLKMSFEAKKRMIGTSAMFLGIVAHPSPLRFAIDSQNHGIQIEDQRGSNSGKHKQSDSKLIVQGDQLPDSLGRKPLEESSQSRLIGKLGKAQQGKKHSIVLEDFGFVDSSKTCHDSIQKSQDQIGRSIVCLPLRNFDIMLEQPTESELVAKSLKKHHPSEVSEMGIVKG